MSYYNVDPDKWDKIVQRMKDKERKHNTMDKNVEKVITQLRDREEEGLRKYGVNTERTDLTSLEWLQHLQEELMDASVYIEKLKNDMKEMQATQEGLLEEINQMQWKEQYEND